MSHSHYFGVAQMAKLRNVPIERWPRDFVIAALGEEDVEESLQLTDPRLADCYRGHDGLYWSHWDDVASRVRVPRPNPYYELWMSAPCIDDPPRTYGDHVVGCPRAAAALEARK